MKFLFDGYDLTLAVVVRKTLLYEFSNHSNQDRAQIIWKPTQEFFESLVKEKPKQVTCFFGKQFQFPKEPGCACQCLYAINHLNEVAYVGTAFNQLAIACYKNRLPRDRVGFLSETRVSRGRLLHCIIPSQTENINELVIMEAVKKFFTSFPQKTLIPALSDALICLLSAQKGAKLEGEILKQAKLTAKPVSKKEKFKKFMEDMIW